MDISRTCDAEFAGPRADCGKSRTGMLAAPSGTPRSVTAHVLMMRGNCITVAEDPATAVTVAADDDDVGHASGVMFPDTDCALLLP